MLIPIFKKNSTSTSFGQPKPKINISTTATHLFLSFTTMVHFPRSIASLLPRLSLVLVLALSMVTEQAHAGPIVAGSAVAWCYSACNAGYVTCMLGCGLVAGVAGPAAGPAAMACSVTQGSCMAACTAGGL